MAPSPPGTVQQLSAPQVRALLDQGQAFMFDVRPEFERDMAKIPEALSLDEAGQKFLLGLDRATPIVFQCHHGMRSMAAAQHFVGEGFTNVSNLKGGIEAWSQLVDPAIPRY